ncbi:MAG: tRNA (adenosine(37)-N6)-threonylcarbamoyltransferase complex transferase subunit TsaD [Acidobacteria bacterium]|nr:tRNA (adenosine(37)-N6)-threonylcarbamoyltransferase complex transferase subunit TsaD [Acidobacteriota bacterium]
MRILGIESSCDETAAAVVEDGTKILSSSVASQLDVHQKYGGVVPELASREHVRAIVLIVREALEAANTKLEDLDAIAVTHGPGLVGSLLVGLTYAKALCFAKGIPLIGVHHLEGHIRAALIGVDLEYPALALVASGGHTHLFECLSEGEYRLEGRTRDDAAGEAYDKVSKLLGLGYPGGPVIDALAAKGNPRAVKFTSPKLKGNLSDFSFSGLKTAVLRWTEARRLRGDFDPATDPETIDMLASFQYTVIEELLNRAARAAQNIGAKALVISGGVASNRGLREAVKARKWPMPVYFPEPKWSTDNGVMIAVAGYSRWKLGHFSKLDLKAQANLPLAR